MNIRNDLQGVITICIIAWSFLKVTYLLRLLTCIANLETPEFLEEYLPWQRILEFSCLSLEDMCCVRTVGSWPLNPGTSGLRIKVLVETPEFLEEY